VILKSNGKPAGTPSDMKNAYFNYWAEDGTTAVFQRWEQRQMKVFLLNLRTGSFKETDAPLDNIVPAAALGGSNPQPAGPNLLKRYRLKDPKLPVHLQLGAAIAKAPPTSRNLKPLFLASDIETEPRALVVGDFNEADLAPDGSAVAYITQGLAVVRPITTADRSAYEQALKAEEKTRLLSQAKQVAVAILIHSADNDDNLISNKVDVAHELEPYVRNKSLLEGLVYTFSGGSASDIGAPAETELGYVPGAGGRAVIYADGHVVWKDDK
jgi:hypothetical protein